MAAVQPQQAASGSDGVDPSRELQETAALHQLQRLQAMRADALTWVAEIERRMGELEQVIHASKRLSTRYSRPFI